MPVGAVGREHVTELHYAMRSEPHAANAVLKNRSGLPGRRRMPLDRAVAQRLFEQAEGLQVLGGAPGDEAGAAAA